MNGFLTTGHNTPKKRNSTSRDKELENGFFDLGFDLDPIVIGESQALRRKDYHKFR